MLIYCATSLSFTCDRCKAYYVETVL